VVLLLRVRDVEQDLLDFAALVRAQLVELQGVDRGLRLRVFLHVERFDRRVQGLRGRGVDGALGAAAFVLALALLALTLSLSLALALSRAARRRRRVALGGRRRRKQ